MSFILTTYDNTTYRINSGKSVRQYRDEDCKGFSIKVCSREGACSLVKRSVFDSAAKPVINTGPKTGWKLSACAKLRYVFPNQICTISQAIDFTDHLSAAMMGTLVEQAIKLRRSLTKTMKGEQEPGKAYCRNTDEEHEIRYHAT